MKIKSLNKLWYDEPAPSGLKLYERWTKLILKEIFWNRLLRKKKKGEFTKKYYISICAIFKNEAAFMQEWLEFHLLMGVNHFYLYNNNSNDDYFGILEPYIEKGIVTLVEWPDVPGQLSAYTHFYNTYRHEAQWISFLDLDEFICPLKATDIPTWLEDYKQYPIIMMYWRMFGTSGQLEHDYSKLVTEQYVVSWDKLDTCGKLLWNTDYEIAHLHLGMMHNFSVICNGYTIPPINSWKRFIEYNIHRTTDDEPSIQVNHYWSKAYNNYKAKHSKGSAAFGKSWKTFDKFLFHEQNNVSSNYAIYRFLIQLRLVLATKNEK